MRKYIQLSIILLYLIGCSKNTDNPSTSTNSILNSSTPSSSTPSSPIVASQLKFSGNGFVHNGTYPKLYTCDSLGISPGLQWSNAPTSTKSFALTMYTIPPTGEKHVYIVLYNIPSTTSSIPDNSKNIGIFGINTVDGKTTYTPPCSQGPGAKIYVLTLYALSDLPVITVPNTKVTMDILVAGMKDKILDSAVMSVTYTRP